MKRTVKRLTAVGLTLTSIMALTACGSSPTTSEATSKGPATKPGKFTIMCDGTVVTQANNGQAFYDQLASATGLEFQWVRPDHASYADAVANAFNSNDTMPDVVVLSSIQYSLYAANGYLWDMTDSWNNSETKNSGRLISTADAIFNALKANGPEGTPALYGFTPTRGNGCVTYVKEKWIKDAGMTKADIENKTFTFTEYYNILKKLHTAHPSVSVISSAGFIGTEAPYTNYLPEFYQQAQYTFYKDSTGKYVDGFAQDAMKQALTRIQTAVKDGIIDQESINNSTANARDKFYSDNSGVFTYWAGTWAETLRANLASRNQPDSLIPLKPIKELGGYLERLSPTWCITTHAQNPEGIFKYFIDTMLDGGDVQTLWQFGAKGYHWDTKAESVTIKGKENDVKTYTDGQFHFLPSTETPTVLMAKNHFDSLGALGKFKNADPSESSIIPLAKTSMQFFSDNSVTAIPLPMTTALGDNIGDINKQRNNIIAAVATGAMSADAGIAEYNSKVGSLVQEVLKSLNK